MNNYLMHYGVKGMKWGVRHDPKRKGRRKKSKLHPATKVLLGVAAVGAGAVVGTYAYRAGILRADTIIKAGTQIQNIGPKSRKFNSSFYGVYDKKSQQHFIKNFTQNPTWFNKEGRTKATILESDKDIKIAGMKEMKKAYKEYAKDNFTGGKTAKEFFHTYGALDEMDRRKFNEILAKKGYGGFKDYNDISIGWGRTPTVFFGSGDYKEEVGKSIDKFGNTEKIYATHKELINTGLKVVKEANLNVHKAKKLKIKKTFNARVQETRVVGMAAVSVGLYGANTVQAGVEHHERANKLAKKKYNKDFEDLTVAQKYLVYDQSRIPN